MTPEQSHHTDLSGCDESSRSCKDPDGPELNNFDVNVILVSRMESELRLRGAEGVFVGWAGAMRTRLLLLFGAFKHQPTQHASVCFYSLHKSLRTRTVS